MYSDNLKAHGGVGDELPLGANYLLILFFSFFHVCVRVFVYACVFFPFFILAERSILFRTWAASFVVEFHKLDDSSHAYTVQKQTVPALKTLDLSISICHE